MEPNYRNSNKSAWILIIIFTILLIIISLLTCTGKIGQKYVICTSDGCDTVSSYKSYPAVGVATYIHNGDTIIVYHAQIDTIK